jgi:hypothetical protein
VDPLYIRFSETAGITERLTEGGGVDYAAARPGLGRIHGRSAVADMRPRLGGFLTSEDRRASLCASRRNSPLSLDCAQRTL